MEFQVKTVYQKDDVEAFQRIVGEQVQKVRTMVSRITFAILGIICIYVGATLLMDNNILMATVSIIIAAFMGYLTFKYYTHLANSAWRRWEKFNGSAPMVYTFTENSVTEGTGERAVESKLEKLFGCYETDRHFFLFLTRRECYILNKSDFVAGDPAQFGAYISRKMGKDVVVVPNKKKK